MEWPAHDLRIPERSGRSADGVRRRAHPAVALPLAGAGGPGAPGHRGMEPAGGKHAAALLLDREPCRRHLRAVLRPARTALDPEPSLGREEVSREPGNRRILLVDMDAFFA